MSYTSNSDGFGHSDEPNDDCPLGRKGIDKRKLHRVASVRKAQGISIKKAAQRLGWSRLRTEKSEDETFDLTVSELLQWQAALEVPLEDLLVEPEVLSRPVLSRTRLLRMMKTALVLGATVKSSQAKALVGRLVEQLTEIMPELRGLRTRYTESQSEKSKFGITAERLFTHRN